MGVKGSGRCSGRGITGTLEFKVAAHVAWQWRPLLFSVGIDPNDMVPDLIPRAIISRRAWLADGGMAEPTFMWRACRYQLWEIVRNRQYRMKRMANYDPQRESRRASSDEWPSSRQLEIAELSRFAMRGLKPRQKIALRMHVAGKKLRAIGKRLGVTRERARQIINKAIFYARHNLRKEAVRVRGCLDDLRVA